MREVYRNDDPDDKTILKYELGSLLRFEANPDGPKGKRIYQRIWFKINDMRIEYFLHKN